MRAKRHVFAVVRDNGVLDSEDPAMRFSVEGVYGTFERATAEIERLSLLNSDRRFKYLWIVSRMEEVEWQSARLLEEEGCQEAD